MRDAVPAEAWLFTDIEGSTRLWQAHPQVMPAAYRLHDEIIRQSTSVEQGEVVSVVGDAFQTTFPSVEHAVMAAMKAQRRLQKEDWPLPEPLRVRMAIHAATVGQKVPALTIRHELGLVLGAAHGEQVLATGAVISRSDGDEGVWTWQALGRHLIRGMEEETPLYQLVARGLRVAFPPLRTRSTHPHNLPKMPDDCHHQRLAEGEIRDHFERGSRWVTLVEVDPISAQETGIASAWALLPLYPDGAYLAKVDGSLRLAVRSSFGVETESEPTTDELAGIIGQRQMLLVLSGMETTVDGVTDLAELLAQCPYLQVIVLAPEPLQSRWERVVYLRDS